MRGDIREPRTNQTLQRTDSSSGSSSPHSSNHEDEIIEVNATGFMPKPIYNFSIPDVIKHDRNDRHDSRRNNNEISVITSRRKRAHPSRNTANNNIANCETPVLGIHNKRQRRAAAAATSVECIEDVDDDCHHSSVVTQVIDLTDIDSHDDSENNATSRNETRPLRHFTRHAPFRDYLTNLERFHQQLRESRERVQFMRSTSLHGLQRLRRRRAPIITDGPLVTSDMLSHSPEVIEATTPEVSTHDDSVQVIDEISGGLDVTEEDHQVALRMLQDPDFSPPYQTPPRTNNLRHPTLEESASYRDFEDRLRALRSHSNERLEQARRISLQAHERLTRIHESITNLQRNRLSTTNSSNNNADEEIRENTNNNNNNSQEEEMANEVEFIREWNPRISYLPQITTLSPVSLRSPNSISNRSTFPDFLVDTFLQSSLPQPRIQHLHHYEELLNLADRLGPGKPKGLSKAELDLIPSFRFSKETAKETNTKCVICMSEYTNREKLRRLPCTHDFHSKCIDKWLRSNITCPICRDEVLSSKDDLLNDK